MPDYSAHARANMRKRGISEADVEYALDHRARPADRRNDRGVDTLQIVGFTPDGDLLKVAVSFTEPDFVVTTHRETS